MTRSGGEAILVGVPRMDVMLNLPAMMAFVLAEKTVKGCWYGSSDVRRDVPKLIDLYQQGPAQARRAHLARDQARRRSTTRYEAMKTGEVARSVVVY